jgi:hypothetical protein
MILGRTSEASSSNGAVAPAARISLEMSMRIMYGSRASRRRKKIGRPFRAS